MQEHDLVALTTDTAGKGLIAGDVGTIVSVHREGKKFTVEFSAVGARTVALALLASSDLRPVSAEEMTQARSFSSAA